MSLPDNYEVDGQISLFQEKGEWSDKAMNPPECYCGHCDDFRMKDECFRKFYDQGCERYKHGSGNEAKAFRSRKGK